MKTINRILLFGDSFVEGQGTYETISEKNEFIEPDLPFGDGVGTIGDWRKNNSWNKFIKERTNCEVINFGRQGSDNYYMFSELNNVLVNYRPTDLLLFGFTSKLRDTGYSVKYAWDYDRTQSNVKRLLHPKNPLNSNIGWEKNLLHIDKYNINLKAHAFYKNNQEKIFTKEFVEDFFVSIYDQRFYENLAQMNYLFYQKWCIKNNINILFFDLFEKYIDETYVNEMYNVDTDMYISYKSKSLVDVVQEYEINHVKDGDVGVWEWGHKRPDLRNIVYHANQHGYKVYIDYLFDTFLDKKYKFEKNINFI